MSNLLSIETLVAIRERDAARAELERLRGLAVAYFAAMDSCPIKLTRDDVSLDEWKNALEEWQAAETALRAAVKPVEDK